MSDAEHPADTTLVETTQPQSNASELAEDQKASNEKKRRRLVTNEVLSWFAACARCSFFLAGYQLEYDRDQDVPEADDDEAGWLKLGWNQSICKLLRKSYGSRLDMDCYHYEGVCPECHRQFVYRTAEDDTIGRFQIELRPRTGR